MKSRHSLVSNSSSSSFVIPQSRGLDEATVKKLLEEIISDYNNTFLKKSTYRYSFEKVILSLFRTKEKRCCHCGMVKPGGDIKVAISEDVEGTLTYLINERLDVSCQRDEDWMDDQDVDPT